jgi:hypothetical protein
LPNTKHESRYIYISIKEESEKIKLKYLLARHWWLTLGKLRLRRIAV